MEIGGAERVIFQLVKCQRESGLKVDILSTSQQSFYARKFADLNATVHCIGQKGGADFTCTRKSMKLARKYDVIHFHNTNLALLLSSLFLGKAQRLFYTRRGADRDYPLRRYLSHRIARFYIKFEDRPIRLLVIGDGSERSKLELLATN